MAKRTYALFIKVEVFALGAEDYRSADVEDDLQ
jgi:hypothetical protein